ESVASGTRRATGNRATSVPAGITSTLPARSGTTSSPVNTLRNVGATSVRAIAGDGNSIRVSAQTADPTGGDMLSKTIGATKRGTHVMQARFASDRANAKMESRRLPAVSIGTYSPSS